MLTLALSRGVLVHLLLWLIIDALVLLHVLPFDVLDTLADLSYLGFVWRRAIEWDVILGFFLCRFENHITSAVLLRRSPPLLVLRTLRIDVLRDCVRGDIKWRQTVVG